VVAASLRVVVASAPSGEHTLSAYRLGRPWQEDKVTWLKSEPASSWTLPGGDAALVASAQQIANDPAPGQPLEFDLGADLQALFDSGEPSHGWLITAGPAEPALQLAARESAFADERPELRLELCPRD
jgi:hypothetical protein